MVNYDFQAYSEREKTRHPKPSKMIALIIYRSVISEWCDSNGTERRRAFLTKTWFVASELAKLPSAWQRSSELTGCLQPVSRRAVRGLGGTAPPRRRTANAKACVDGPCTSSDVIMRQGSGRISLPVQLLHGLVPSSFSPDASALMGLSPG